MTLTDLVIGKVKDASGKLGPGDYDSAITEALNRYSSTKPHESCADLPGSGSHDLVLPVDWQPDFSDISSVEYPVGNIPATMLDNDFYQLYRSPAGLKLRILHTTINTGKNVRCQYTLLHTEATLPANDLEAVANLAASLCLRQLAAVFGQTNDPTIQADVVNYRSKADEFRRLADSFEQLYKTHLGLKDSDTVAAASAVALPPDRKSRWWRLWR